MAIQDASDLVQLGLKVDFLCLDQTAVYRSLMEQALPFLKIIPLEFQPRNILDFRLRAVLHRSVEGGVNLIHLHQPSLLPTVVPWLMSFPCVGLIATRHILSQHNKKDILHRLLYRRVDSLVVMSQALRQNVIETHPIAERRVKVVHLGLDFKLFDPEKGSVSKRRESWGVSPDAIVIGMVGRIDPAKGQKTLIQAVANLIKTRRGLKSGESPLKVVFVGEETVGSSHSYLAELRTQISQMGLDQDMLFVGYQVDIPEVMKACDIVVMPSLLEAFGLVAIEAMAMERPVILSKGGSAMEIVGEQEEFGLAVHPEDPEDLEKKLSYLLNSPEERSRMGKRARQHVLSHFDRKLRISKTLSLYEHSLRLRRVV